MGSNKQSKAYQRALYEYNVSRGKADDVPPKDGKATYAKWMNPKVGTPEYNVVRHIAGQEPRLAYPKRGRPDKRFTILDMEPVEPDTKGMDEKTADMAEAAYKEAVKKYDEAYEAFWKEENEKESESRRAKEEREAGKERVLRAKAQRELERLKAEQEKYRDDDSAHGRKMFKEWEGYIQDFVNDPANYKMVKK